MNAFLSSFLFKYLLEDFHSFSSNPDAILNDGIVRPIFFSNKQNLMIEYNEYNTIEEEREGYTPTINHQKEKQFKNLTYQVGFCTS